MKINNRWFQIIINDDTEKYYVYIGIFTKHWSAGIVSWNDREYWW